MTCEVNFDIFNYENIRGECSGHGFCNTTTLICGCEDGFTGLSDWINTDLVDCQLNLNVVYGLWALNAGLALLMQIIVMPKVRDRFTDFKEKQQTLRSQGKKELRIRNNKGLVAILSYEILVLPSMLLYAIMKWAMPEERVGVTFLATFLFAFVKVSFYVGVAYMFQPALIKTLLSSKTLQKNLEIQRLIRLSDAFALMNVTASVAFSFLPFATYANGGKLNYAAELAWIAYLAGSIISLLIYCAQAFYLKREIVKVLDAAGGGSKESKPVGIQKTKAALVKMQNGVMIQTLLNSVLYSLFLFWPYLWNKHDYMLPCSWIAFIMVSKNISETHISSSKTGASKTGDGSKHTFSKSTKDSESVIIISKQNSGSFLQTKTPAPPSSMPLSSPPTQFDLEVEEKL